MFIGYVLIACSNLKAQEPVTTPVGVIEDGKAVMTLDKESVLSIYNANLLSASKIDGQFTDVGIEDRETEEGIQYYLVFRGERYISSFAIEVQEQQLLALAGISCTTSDCASELGGCVPAVTSCTPCSNQGKCTKTISNISLIEQW